MERVTFVVERTGERIPCLLNPEFLEVRRFAGVARRRGAGGSVIGNPRSDDPLVATGGGTTDYELKLLFDVDLFATPAATGAVPGTATPAAAAAPSSASASDGTAPASTLMEAEEPAPASTSTPSSTPAPPTDPGSPIGDTPQPGASPSPGPVAAQPQPSIDVRSLTQPLWALAENGSPVSGSLATQRVRFVWGRSWNVPGVILAVAERLECFDSQGVPKRSWLSLRMRRVEEEQEAANAPAPPTSPQFELNPARTSDGASDDSVVVPVDEDGASLTPLHMIAAERYGDPRYDRAIAEYNGLDDLLELVEGQPIRLPPASSIVGTA